MGTRVGVSQRRDKHRLRQEEVQLSQQEWGGRLECVCDRKPDPRHGQSSWSRAGDPETLLSLVAKRSGSVAPSHKRAPTARGKAILEKEALERGEARVSGVWDAAL